MVAKELNMAMAAYNLVRAITYIAAERAGMGARGYSFTRVRNVGRGVYAVGGERQESARSPKVLRPDDVLRGPSQAAQPQEKTPFLSQGGLGQAQIVPPPQEVVPCRATLKKVCGIGRFRLPADFSTASDG